MDDAFERRPCSIQPAEHRAQGGKVGHVCRRHLDLRARGLERLDHGERSSLRGLAADQHRASSAALHEPARHLETQPAKPARHQIGRVGPDSMPEDSARRARAARWRRALVRGCARAGPRADRSSARPPGFRHPARGAPAGALRHSHSRDRGRRTCTRDRAARRPGCARGPTGEPDRRPAPRPRRTAHRG